LIEPDVPGFLATPISTPTLPSFGYGDTPREALDALTRDLEALVSDLHGDGRYSPELEKIRSWLKGTLCE
jgi:hypothetical protein